MRIAVADADKQLETAAATALEMLTNKLAHIGADEVMAAADDELSNAVSAAIQETIEFHQGLTNPAYQRMPVQSKNRQSIVDQMPPA